MKDNPGDMGVDMGARKIHTFEQRQDDGRTKRRWSANGMATNRLATAATARPAT